MSGRAGMGWRGAVELQAGQVSIRLWEDDGVKAVSEQQLVSIGTHRTPQRAAAEAEDVMRGESLEMASADERGGRKEAHGQAPVG